MLQRVVEGLNQPAYITGRRWDVLAWNKAAADIFAFDRVPEEDRNTLIIVLTRPQARRLFGDAWLGAARRMVAEFRATHDLWAGDPAFLDLIARLRAGCPEFAGWWDAHEVRGAAAGVKTLHHPRRGAIGLSYATFQSNDDPALKLVIYTPATR
jgi:PAS domain-containing protein